MQRLLLVLFAGLLTVPALPRQTPSGGDAGAIAKVLSTQAAAWNRGDIPGFMNGYWRSPQTEFIGAEGVTRGWQGVRDRYLKKFANTAAMGHLAFSNLEVHVLCPDAAYVLGNFQLTQVKDNPHGVFTLLFRRFPEGWRVISDHTTSQP